MILFDTWIWVEYFKGSEIGKRVLEIVKKNKIYTSSISIAEISKWLYENGSDIEFGIEQIRQNSEIIPLEEIILIRSGVKYVEIRKKKKDIGMIDIIIYTTAEIHNLKLLTGDSDFEGLPNVEIMQ